MPAGAGTVPVTTSWWHTVALTAALLPSLLPPLSNGVTAADAHQSAVCVHTGLLARVTGFTVAPLPLLRLSGRHSVGQLFGQLLITLGGEVNWIGTQ